MPAMDDPNFIQTVTYICEHNNTGALGIVINRPTTIRLTEILEQMDIHIDNQTVNDLPIFYGGPVHQERGFVIHRPFGEWRSSFATAEDIAVTTSRDILQAIAASEGPQKALIALGFAGWEEGQLEEELTKNIWLSCPADSKILFDTPYEIRWQAAASLLGVNISVISGDVGHA
jgi:putative transcriptional regulator